MQFTTPIKSLITLLDTAKEFAGTDETLPMLRCVFVERVGRDLFASGTDRFRLGVNTVSAEFDDDFPAAWSFMIERDDVEIIAASFKAAKATDKATVVVEADSLQVSVPGFAVQLRIVHQQMEFPNYRSLLAATEYGEIPAGSMVNGDFLTSFKKVQRSKRDTFNVRFPSESGRPVRVVCGDYFVGILMPVREGQVDIAILDKLGVAVGD